MAKKPDAGDGKKKKGKLGMILPIVLLVVGVLVGKTFLGGGGGGEHAATGETTTTTEKPLAVTVPSMTVTLGDGNVAKIGVTMYMAKDFAVVPPVKDDPTGGYPEAMDAVITVMSAETREPLLTAAGKDHLKLALLEQLKLTYHEEIRGVGWRELLVT
jgi:flagellar basal body-associated protein FliL